jgi:hypothetical protein
MRIYEYHPSCYQNFIQSEKVCIDERDMIRLFQVAINKNFSKRIAVGQALITSKT